MTRDEILVELQEKVRLSKLTRQKRDPRYAAMNTAWVRERRKTWTPEEWEKHRQRNRDYYARKKKEIFEKTRIKKATNKLKAIEHLGGCCSKCKQIYTPQAMDFHHVDDNKEHNIGRLLAYSWEKIEQELVKCILLCANCHREIHSGNT